MKTDLTQLEGALHQIAWAADALEGIRRGVDAENAHVFPITAEAYIRHIRAMTAEARACAARLSAPAEDPLHATEEKVAA